MTERRKQNGPRSGGLAARERRGPLWQFRPENDGSFTAPDAQYIRRLYFPLCNLRGMRSSVTPELKGDLCADFRHYLSIPTVSEDLAHSKNGRNVWISVAGRRPWSATGVDAAASAALWEETEPGRSVAQGGIGWFKLARNNAALGLRAVTTVFVPSADDAVEVIRVEIENTGSRPVRFKLTGAIPIFGRPADHLRDHRHVTTILNRIREDRFGVVNRPTIYHDEKGHSANAMRYAVFGMTGAGRPPKHIWSTMREFIGEGGSLENPEALFKDLTPPRQTPADRHGRECVGAVQFAPVTLRPGGRAAFILLECITENQRELTAWKRRYGTAERVERAFRKTVAYWQGIANAVEMKTPDSDFNNWARWVAAQLFYRKIFGNSYLPDFGYGRGGRGWRDLWSDLLSLFLVDPEGSREEIVNNFRGVRVDGTNATIVGTRPGEFVVDRNDIVRVWCDHGSWPFWVLSSYMELTGDYDILLLDLPYWKDHLAMRCRQRDLVWDSQSYGPRQKTAAGKIYQGTILEHVLLEILSTFYHVGRHNNILLEGGDWNDCYDNARIKGESVCFTHFYAGDLFRLADTLDYLAGRGLRQVALLSELLPLLDRLPGRQRIDYRSPRAKREALDRYMEGVSHLVSGRKTKVSTRALAADLRAKAEFLVKHLRKNEWITTREGFGFFNGHYDDDSVRVHGDHPNGVRIDLTSQVLPTLFGTAGEEQVDEMYRSVRRYLTDRGKPGIRLMADFKEPKLSFGRATAFAYGHKEHGSIWNQQNVMYMTGLYTRNRVRQGYRVLKDVLKLCMDSGTSRIFPGIPSYFTRERRGSYMYLTGSATWVFIGMVTQMFGVRGEHGNLLIEPKLLGEQFGEAGRTGLALNFAGRRLDIVFENPNKLDWGRYGVKGVAVNGKPAELAERDGGRAVLIERERLLALCTRKVNKVRVQLG